MSKLKEVDVTRRYLVLTHGDVQLMLDLLGNCDLVDNEEYTTDELAIIARCRAWSDDQYTHLVFEDEF